MTRLLFWLFVGLVGFGLVTFAGQHDYGPLVVTREGEQKIIFNLGAHRKTTEPGWDLRIPIPVLETVESYPARWLHADTNPLLVDTRDGEQLQVDNYVVWRIADPKSFRESFQRSQTRAESRIDRIVQDRVREVMGRHALIEVLTDQRESVTREITESVAADLLDLGIEIRDVRINRTELPGGTEGSVFARMKTERERLAKKSRAEGDEKARVIRAEADRDARVIVANARRDAAILRGRGDADAARIYAEAYETAPEFYAFMRSLEAYRGTIDQNMTLIISPDSEFFKYLDANGK